MFCFLVELSVVQQLYCPYVVVVQSWDKFVAIAPFSSGFLSIRHIHMEIFHMDMDMEPYGQRMAIRK
jgi:hypothetical protein